jgi:hypothetical protein
MRWHHPVANIVFGIIFTLTITFVIQQREPMTVCYWLQSTQLFFIGQITNRSVAGGASTVFKI